MAEEKSFKGYIVSVILVSLFVLAIYNFAGGIGTEYNENYATEYLGQAENYIGYDNISTSLDEFSGSTEAWEEQSQQDSPFTSGGDVLFLGLWDVMTGMWNSVKTLFNVFAFGLSKLGVPLVAIGVFVGLFLIGLIFAGWRAIKQG